MAIVEPITLEVAKAQCRVRHDDEDALIVEYIQSARARCEVLIGRKLSYDDETEDEIEIHPSIKQAVRVLVHAYWDDRGSEGIGARVEAGETAVQNLLINHRLMPNDTPEDVL